MKPDWIARQSRKPVGWIGRVVARVMARETHSANAFALAQLQVEPDHSVLEIGCGHGRTLEQLTRRVPAGFAAGIDPSDVMVKLATRRLRTAIERGRADVQTAEAARLPFEDERFDAALAVHVLYFWPDPALELREIRRVLRPGGILVLGFRPDGPSARANLPESIYHMRTVTEVERLLAQAAFEPTRAAQMEPGAAPFVCLSARAAS